MKIKFIFIVLLLVISILLECGVGLTAEILMGRENYLNSFYNNELVVICAWTGITLIITIIIKIFKMLKEESK